MKKLSRWESSPWTWKLPPEERITWLQHAIAIWVWHARPLLGKYVVSIIIIAIFALGIVTGKFL